MTPIVNEDMSSGHSNNNNQRRADSAYMGQQNENQMFL